jgi:hypothetical protein
VPRPPLEVIIVRGRNVVEHMEVNRADEWTIRAQLRRKFGYDVDVVKQVELVGGLKAPYRRVRKRIFQYHL